MSAGGSSTAAGTAPVLTGADEKSTAAAVSPATTSNNPGSYEELHRKCRDVFPMCFEGAKVMVQKGLSSHFQVIFNCTNGCSSKFGQYFQG